MDLQKIKQLIDVLAASDLAELELVEGDHRVRLVKRVGAGPATVPLGVAGLPASASAIRLPDTVPPSQSPPPDVDGELVTAPLYGVLHLTPSPDAPAFVQLGDTVQAGQTLCVLEAMKMFHEVKSSRAGTVMAIHAAAGVEVDAGAVLFQLVVQE
jgi:acetyl-CoA carboxylase biotin carboxyl carrier protein